MRGITRINFQEIRRRRVVTGRCHTCGKNTRRTLVDFQTLNPFNVNKETGYTKIADEIEQELKASLDKREEAWRSAPVCSKCE